MNKSKYGFLYPCHPLEKSQPEPEYLLEYKLARLLGIPVVLFNYDKFSQETKFEYDASEWSHVETIIYRGWMVLGLC